MNTVRQSDVTLHHGASSDLRAASLLSACLVCLFEQAESLSSHSSCVRRDLLGAGERSLLCSQVDSYRLVLEAHVVMNVFAAGRYPACCAAVMCHYPSASPD